MTQELIERLHKLADRQRRERGDAMYLGEHDPEISEAADALQSQSARIAELEGERDRLESALRIELWNARMLRGGKQDAVIAQINKEIASIKATGRPQTSITKDSTSGS